MYEKYIRRETLLTSLNRIICDNYTEKRNLANNIKCTLFIGAIFCIMFSIIKPSNQLFYYY